MTDSENGHPIYGVFLGSQAASQRTRLLCEVCETRDEAEARAEEYNQGWYENDLEAYRYDPGSFDRPPMRGHYDGAYYVLPIARDLVRKLEKRLGGIEYGVVYKVRVRTADLMLEVEA